jgi:hypothetical protein
MDIMLPDVFAPLRWPAFSRPDLGNVVDVAISSLLQMLCAVRGHDFWLRLGNDRMSLKCAGCGHETAGWDIGPPRFRRGSVGARGDVPKL